MRQAIARHMVESRHVAAHCTTIVEADFSRIAARRAELRLETERRGVNLTYLVFVVAPLWTLPSLGSVATNSYALALILLVNTLPWRPGAAPAFPVNRWVRRRSGASPIPPARRPTGS